jgi:hypothetical protein
MKEHGVTKKVRLSEKEAEEPLWRSNRLRDYITIALTVVVIAIAGGLALKYMTAKDSKAVTYGAASYAPADDSLDGKVILLEKTGDEYAARGSWNDAASAYLNAIHLMDYNVSYSEVPRIFGKYCQSKSNLGRQRGGTCTLTNPRDGRTLVRQM